MQQPFSWDEVATVNHEYYLSLRRAGFTRAEALWLIGCLIKGVPFPDLPDDEPQEPDV